MSCLIRMMKTLLTCLSLALSFLRPAVAGPHHEPPVMPKAFDFLRGLVGTWEGTTKMGEKEMPVTVIYELTSGGTAVSEKLFPGTPHEMVSMYYRNGKSLGMTHYCAVGNQQPHMEMTAASDKSLSFELKKSIGIDSLKESHMHALTLTMLGPDTLKQDWVNFEKGKKAEGTSFEFRKKK